MKRFSALLLAICMVLGSVAAAKADGIDVKVSGQWDFAFGWATNTAFKDSAHGNSKKMADDDFISRSRVRAQVNFIASENLQGVLMFEIGDLNWGRGGKVGQGSGSDLDADGVNVETKRAYLDWLIPNTSVSVRMGIQGVTLPNVMGSPIFDADVAGVLVSSPINDNFSIAAFWLRPFDAYANDDGSFNAGPGSLDDETDIFGLLLPIKFDGFKITPWGMFGRVGNASGAYSYLFSKSALKNPVTFDATYEADTASAWWVGMNFNVTMFDPLSFKMDAMYGRLGKNDLAGINGWRGVNGNTDFGSKGWFIVAALDYKFDWGTPGLFGWYASGDDYDDVVDDGWLGRIPALGTDGGFKPTTFGFNGNFSIATDNVISQSGAGTWGVGIRLADVSFVKDLSHTLRVVYYRGTNDKELAGLADSFRFGADSLYLTEDDKVWEVNFDHKYKIYENLTAVVELGYLHLSTETDTWGRSMGDDDSDNAWKAQLLLQYKF